MRNSHFSLMFNAHVCQVRGHEIGTNKWAISDLDGKPH